MILSVMFDNIRSNSHFHLNSKTNRRVIRLIYILYNKYISPNSSQSRTSPKRFKYLSDNDLYLPTLPLGIMRNQTSLSLTSHNTTNTLEELQLASC
jgi:hypothetical protein